MLKKGVLIIFFILFGLYGTVSCRAEPTPIRTEQSTTSIASLAVPSSSPSMTSSPTPSSTSTPTPFPTETPPPTSTATSAPTATNALINASNATYLKQVASFPVTFLKGELIDAGWSPDDRTILLHTSKGLYLLDPKTLEERAFFSGLSLKASSTNILITYENKSLGWIDLATEEFHSLDIPEAQYSWQWLPLAIDSQGKILATIDEIEPDTLLLYGLPGGELIDKIKLTHEKGVRQIWDILFSPDGSTLFINIQRTDTRFSLIRLDLAKPDSILELATELGFYNLRLSPDGNRFTYLSDQAIVRTTSAGNLWNTLSTFFPSEVNNQKVYFNGRQISFRDDHSLGIAYSFWGNDPQSILLVWDINTGGILETYDHIPGEITSLDFSHDGNNFLVTTQDGLIRVYDGEGEEIAVSEPYDSRGNVDISPDGALIAVPSAHQVRIYDLKQNKVIKTLGDFPASYLINVQFLNSIFLVVTVYPNSGDAYTELWDLSTNEIIRKYDVSNCIFSQDQSRLACQSKYLQVLDAEKGAILGSFGTANQTFDYKISPDGQVLSVCSYAYIEEKHQSVYSEAIGLWDIDSQMRIRNLLKEGSACGNMGFSPQGDYLISAAGAIWQVSDGTLLGTFEGNPPGKILMAQGNDFFLFDNALIEIPSGVELGKLQFNGNPIAMRFTEDGYYLVVLTNQELTFWRVIQ